MGFLDKLFGNTPKQEEKQQTKPKVMAQFKNEKYFNKEIQYFIKIMELLKEDNKEYIKKHGIFRQVIWEHTQAR